MFTPWNTWWICSSLETLNIDQYPFHTLDLNLVHVLKLLHIYAKVHERGRTNVKLNILEILHTKRFSMKWLDLLAYWTYYIRTRMWRLVLQQKLLNGNALPVFAHKHQHWKLNTVKRAVNRQVRTSTDLDIVAVQRVPRILLHVLHPSTLLHSPLTTNAGGGQMFGLSRKMNGKVFQINICRHNREAE